MEEKETKKTSTKSATKKNNGTSKNKKSTNAKKVTTTAKKETKTSATTKPAPKNEKKKEQAKKVEAKTEVKTTSQAKTSTNKKSTNTKKPNKPTPKYTPKKLSAEEEAARKEKMLEKTIIFDGVQNKNISDVVNKLEEENVVLDDKVIKRSKGRKIAIYILIAMIIAVIASTIYYVVDLKLVEKENDQTINSNVLKKVRRNYKNEDEVDSKSPSSSQNAIQIEEIDYSRIETISLAEFEKKVLAKEDMIVLIASSTCYHCITYEPIVNEAFESLDKNIYRINIIALTSEQTNRFRTYYAFRVAPTIFVIKDGVVTADVTGTLSKNELVSWVQENFLK